MIAPQNLQFYVAEPIGGGGTALVSVEADVQDYFEFARKIGAKDIQYWEQVLEWGQSKNSLHLPS